MSLTTASRGSLVSEPPAGSRLENMSSRPTTVVTHTGSGLARQLVPSLRVGLEPRRAELARAQRRPVLALDLPPALAQAEPPEQARMVEGLCAAVIADLRLPGVVPLGPDGQLPDETVRHEPLLALVVLTRCSGPVWLRDRVSALERLTSDRPVRLLLQPDHFRHVIARLDAPDWEAQMLARAQASERWS